MGGSIKLTRQERDVLVHALMGSGRSGKAYRNYFASGPGHEYYECIKRMCDHGLMMRGRPINGGSDHYYHATHDGAEAIGVSLPEE